MWMYSMCILILTPKFWIITLPSTFHFVSWLTVVCEFGSSSFGIISAFRKDVFIFLASSHIVLNVMPKIAGTEQLLIKLDKGIFYW